MVIGFSTGSLALGNFRLGLKMVAGKSTAAVELSALRDVELQPLVESLDALDLSQFDYISVHAPSRFESVTEMEVLALLEPVFERAWPVVVHPDAIRDFSLWKLHGGLVCIENMDKRKPLGRTAAELSTIFASLPDASLCFDIGHARQIDPTMREARKILAAHGSRLRQVHLSDVTTTSAHEPLGFTALLGYRQIAHLLPSDVPVILETPVGESELEDEMRRAERLLVPH